MKNVGFIGWRGMVGSVLMQRMIEERDFDAIRPVFSQHLSTVNLRQPLPVSKVPCKMRMISTH